MVPGEVATSAPILFAFHGIGDSPESMASYTRLDRLSVRSGFVLVYLEALNSMWATINVDPLNLDSNPDVRFFDRMLEDMEAIHEIDKRRIYLVGMSNGATFAQLLAVSHSEQIAAVVAHSGTRPKSMGACKTPVPMMLIVGAEDPVASIIEADAERYRQWGHTVEFISVSGLGHSWSIDQNEKAWRFLSKQSVDLESQADQSARDSGNVLNSSNSVSD